LKWTQYGGVAVSGYDIYRYDNKGGLHIISSMGAADTQYTDTNVVCAHHYAYLIRARLSNSQVSLSDSFGLTIVDTVPPPKSYLYVISVDSTLISGGKISMRFTGNNKINRSGFNIYRQENGGVFQLYDQLPSFVTDTVYWQDQGANTADNTYAYYIVATDSCGNQALAGDTDRSVHITAKAYSQYFQLNWTPYLGFKKWGYAIEKRTVGAPWQKIASANMSTLSYIDSNVSCHVYYQYRIRYNDETTQLFGFSNISGDTAIDTTAPKNSQLQYATIASTGISNGQVKLSWDASQSGDVQGYLVYRSLDNHIWAQDGKMVQGLSYIDSDLNTYRQNYYYKIAPVDSCGNAGAGFSQYHATMVLNVQGGDQKAFLNWNPYIGWKVKSYLIIKDGAILATVGDTVTNYTDTLVNCRQYYHYVIEAVADTPLRYESYSNTDSVKPYDNIAPAKVYIRSASVDVAAKQVVVSWDSSASFDVKDYDVYRKRASDGEMVFVESTTKTICYEPLSDISGADCYYVFANDYCGNRSDGSNRACLIILQGMNNRAYNSLSWNSYGDWPDGISRYNIYKEEDSTGWNKIGSTLSGIDTFSDKNLTDAVIDYCYQVEAIENIGKNNATSRSTVVCLHQDPYVYIPNAFTPNTSPGINDSFGPTGMFIKNYSMTIYNRWGETVYQTSNGGRWDGLYDGVVAQEGIYMYIITVEGYNNKSVRYKGNLMILY